MENKFTKGPWEVIRYNDLQYSIYNQGEGYVEKDISDEEDIANEKLIAAAPDLYEALKELLECDYTSGTHLYTAQLKAKAAIKKAIE